MIGRELAAIGRKARVEQRMVGLAYARKWRAQRRFLPPATIPEQPRFPYPGHRTCAEWTS